jgi:hypothetical protein
MKPPLAPNKEVGAPGIEITLEMVCAARSWLAAHDIRDPLDLDDAMIRDFLATALSKGKGTSNAV